MFVISFGTKKGFNDISISDVIPPYRSMYSATGKTCERVFLFYYFAFKNKTFLFALDRMFTTTASFNTHTVNGVNSNF